MARGWDVDSESHTTDWRRSTVYHSCLNKRAPIRFSHFATSTYRKCLRAPIPRSRLFRPRCISHSRELKDILACDEYLRNQQFQEHKRADRQFDRPTRNAKRYTPARRPLQHIEPIIPPEEPIDTQGYAIDDAPERPAIHKRNPISAPGTSPPSPIGQLYTLDEAPDPPATPKRNSILIPSTPPPRSHNQQESHFDQLDVGSQILRISTIKKTTLPDVPGFFPSTGIPLSAQ